MRMTNRTRTVPAVIALLALASAPACRHASQPEPVLPSASAADVALPPETMQVRAVVPRSTTLSALLNEHGVASDGIGHVVEAVRSVFDPRRLRSFQPFLLERTLAGGLRVFEYEIDADSFLRVAREDQSSGGLKAEVLPIPKTLEDSTAWGMVDREASSLFAAMKAAGEGPDLAVKLAELFSGEIDFNSDVQLGDRFALSYERFRRADGGPSTYGDILSAEFESADGGMLRAIRFAPEGGRADYYDEQGRSLRRLFLKSPLKFAPRVTSGFSLRRMHPVLHTARAHRGVDYGAPTGAPVVSVAAGTVVSVTSDRANGRMVRIRHASGYQTYYLHLSKFASGMRAGVRVGQGDVIGYVGSTGLATGPHLHYGLTKNGVFVNPITEHQRMPPGDPIPASAMSAFAQVRDRALRNLADVSNTHPQQIAALTTPKPGAP